MIQSKFTRKAFLPIALLLLCTPVIAIVFITLLNNSTFSPFGIFAFFGAFTFAWIWLVFGELRRNATKVVIEENAITISNYLGVGAVKTYALKEFDGFKISQLAAEWNSYEYLYIISEGREVVIISEYYHKNYQELKHRIQKKVKHLGTRRSSFWIELMAIFK